MNRLNHPAVAMLFLIAFCLLALYALHRHDREIGYTHSIFDILPKSLSQRQAEAYKELYHLKGNEVASAIWGE